MFGLESLPVEAIGVLAAFIAGLLTLIPALGLTDQRRAITAVVVLIIAVFTQDNFAFVSWQGFLHEFFTAAVYAVVSYKLILQPLVLPAIDRGLVSAGAKTSATYQG